MFQYADGKERVIGVIEIVCANFFGVEYYPEIYDKAAAILYYLILDHLMVEGNKRFAMATTEVFLRQHGYGWRLSVDEYVEVAVRIADERTRPPLDSVRQWMASRVYRLGSDES